MDERRAGWTRGLPVPVACCAAASAVLLGVGLLAKLQRIVEQSCSEPVWIALAPYVVSVLTVWVWLFGFPLIAAGAVIVRVWRGTPVYGTLRGRMVRSLGVVLGVAALGALHTYLHWPVFTIDDGPYYGAPYDGDPDALPLASSIPLVRGGRPVYRLETRATDQRNAPTVFVLRADGGNVRWAVAPRCQATLGLITLSERYTRRAWWGGWTVTILPANQEAGQLYLGPFGGYRYFYHSW